MQLLPFEKLLDSLRLQGFSLGVDAHLRINQLLNEWEGGSVEELRVQLGALLARDLKEQESFYRAFDAFVAAHSYQPLRKKEENRPLDFFPWLMGLIALLTLSGIAYSLYRANTGVDAGFEYYQSAYTYQTWFRDTSRVKQLSFFTSDSISQRSFLLDDTLLYERDQVITFEPSQPGLHKAFLSVESRRGGDSVVKEIPVSYPLDPELQNIATTGTTVTYRLRVNSHIRQLPSEALQRIVEEVDSLFWKKNTVTDSIRIFWGEEQAQIRGVRKDEGVWIWEGEGQGWSDSLTLKEDTLRYTYETYGNKEVELWLSSTWYDRTTGEKVLSQKGDRELLPIELIPPEEEDNSPVSLNGIDLEPQEEDLSDLVKDPPRGLRERWPLGLTLLILLLAGLYELRLFYLRRVVLDTTAQGSPSQKALKIPRPLVALFRGEVYEMAARRLRRRRLGEGEEVDIPASLKKTISQGGIPELIWARRAQASQYLFLIEEHSQEDQLARYVGEWVVELRSRDISAEAWYYDPGMGLGSLWKKRHQGLEIDLSRLLIEHSTYRVIVVGSPGALVDSQALGKLSEAGKLLTQVPVRGFLSTRPTEEWGYEEGLIGRFFALGPAGFEGLGELVSQWEEDLRLPIKKWKRESFEPPPPELEEEGALEELRYYLGPKGFRWLCCCAIYPELYWELTLYYGKLVGLLSEEGSPMDQGAERVLLRLLRLEAFRKGRLSRELRKQLHSALKDEGLLTDVRAYIIELLEQPFNQAPQDSVARQQQEATLAIYKYLNSDKEAADQEALKKEIDKIPAHRLQKDVVSLQSVQKVRDPSTIKLPRSFYREGIPIKGTRRVTRLGAVLLALLSFWGIYWASLQYWAPESETEPFYEQERLDLASVQNQARWELYEGYKRYQDSGYQAALPHYERAFQLDSANQKARINLSKTRFALARSLYEKENFVSAAIGFAKVHESFNRIVGLLISMDQIYQLSSRESIVLGDSLIGTLINEEFKAAIDTNSLLQASFYAEGLSWVYEGEEDLKGLLGLYIAGSPMFTDSLSLYNLAPDKEKVYLKLLEVSQRAQTSVHRQYLDSLQAWMGKEIPDTWEPILADAIRLLTAARNLESNNQFEEAQSTYERARTSFDEVLVFNATQPEAIAGKRESLLAIDRITARLGDMQASLLLNAAEAYRLENACDSAMELYQQVLDLNPAEEYRQQAREGITACGEVDIPSDSVGVESSEPAPVDSIPLPRLFADPIPDPGSIPQIDMVEVSGGRFDMGSNDEQSIQGTLSDFEISTYEVTQELWQAVMGSNPSYFKGDNLPVEQVSWEEVIIFCNTLSRALSLEPVYALDSNTGSYVFNAAANGYRLPTEAEWEYAAKGGNRSQGYLYAGSDSLEEVGWYWKNSGDTVLVGEWDLNLIDENNCRTHPVGQKDANELGLYDMSGQCVGVVLGLVWSLSRRSLEGSQGARYGSGPCVARWVLEPRRIRTAACPIAYSYVPSYRSYTVGFRLARAVPGGQ